MYLQITTVSLPRTQAKPTWFRLVLPRDSTWNSPRRIVLQVLQTTERTVCKEYYSNGYQNSEKLLQKPLFQVEHLYCGCMLKVIPTKLLPHLAFHSFSQKHAMALGTICICRRLNILGTVIVWFMSRAKSIRNFVGRKFLESGQMVVRMGSEMDCAYCVLWYGRWEDFWYCYHAVKCDSVMGSATNPRRSGSTV
jgi:hypothetical protein